MTEKEYGKLVKSMEPKSPVWKDCLFAFIIGGLICTLGQVFIHLYAGLGLDKTNSSTAASMSLVLLSALLTGLSLYDNIAKYAGAGTLVPITGFANAIQCGVWVYLLDKHIILAQEGCCKTQVLQQPSFFHYSPFSFSSATRLT